MEGALAALLRRRWLALGAALVIAIALGAASSRLIVRNDLAVWFVEGDPALESYLSFRERFGSDEVVVLALQPPAARASGAQRTGIDAARLARLDLLVRKLAADPDVERTAALSSAVTTDTEGVLGPVVQGEVGEDDAARAALALERSRLARQLAGEDEALLVWLWMKRDAGFDARRGAAYARLREVVAGALAGSDETVSWAGGGLVWDELNRATEQEGAAFIGLAYLIVLFALILATRRAAWTFAAIAVVTLADTCLFGVIALSGTPLNAVTVALPTLVMVLGVANVLHLTFALERLEGEARTDRAAIARTMAGVAVPAAFNNLTTVIGFLSLSFATTAITRQVGVFSAVGVTFAFAFSFVIIAVMAPRALRRPRRPLLRRREELLARLTFPGFRPWRLAGPLLVGALVAGAAGTRVVVDTDTLGFLPDTHPLRASFSRVEAVAGPIIPVEIELRPASGPSSSPGQAPGPPSGSWRDPRFLRALDDARAALAAAPEPRVATSVADLIADSHAALKGLSASSLPASPEDIEGALAFLEASAPDAFAPFVDEKSGAVRMTVRVPVGTARHLVAEADRAREIVGRAVEGQATVAVTGYLPLYGRIVSTLVDDQVASFLFAFLLIFAAIGVYFRDVRFVVLAALPNLVPIAVVFGSMTALSIRLDVATMTVASTILGIVVDDTVHTLHRLRAGLRAGLALEEAIAGALRHAGVANLTSNLILVAGFVVLALAPVKTVSSVGVLSAIAVAAALATDVILLPPLARILYARAPLPGAPPTAQGRAPE
jgi:uncharacterized protein